MIGAARNGIAVAYGASLLNIDLTSAPLIPLRLVSLLLTGHQRRDVRLRDRTGLVFLVMFAQSRRRVVAGTKPLIFNPQAACHLWGAGRLWSERLTPTNGFPDDEFARSH